MLLRVVYYINASKVLIICTLKSEIRKVSIGILRVVYYINASKLIRVRVLIICTLKSEIRKVSIGIIMKDRYTYQGSIRPVNNSL